LLQFFLGEEILFEPYLDLYWTGVFFFLGAIFGSFANVVILRLPQKMSVVSPGSHCYQCKTPVKFYDNIPIVSWLILRGKCRKCGAKFSFRYCLVEIIMATLFSACFYKYNWSYTLFEVLILMFGLVVVSFIDLDHFIIPDKISLPGIVVGLVGALLNPERHILDAVLGMLLGGGFLWAVAYIYYLIKKQEGMGGGDIKLLAWIGTILGWRSIPFTILASSILGSIIGLFFIWRSKGNLKSVIPFGPYIALAAIIYIFGGEAIGHWYISLFMPGLD
jgi:leader peptidase (prepilin peptidase)/N-methyltransferase